MKLEVHFITLFSMGLAGQYVPSNLCPSSYTAIAKSIVLSNILTPWENSFQTKQIFVKFYAFGDKNIVFQMNNIFNSFK
jgi:hypothetical protein